MYEKWCRVLDTVPEKEQALEQELAKQHENDKLRLEFAEKANAIGAYIDERSAALSDLSMGATGGTMEEQLATVKAFQAETLEYQPQIEAAESANQVCGKHMGTFGCDYPLPTEHKYARVYTCMWGVVKRLHKM